MTTLDLNKIRKKAILWGLPTAKVISEQISYPLIKQINQSNMLKDALNIRKYEKLVRLGSNGITSLREDGKLVSRFKVNHGKGFNLQKATGVLAILASMGFQRDSLEMMNLLAIAGAVTPFNPDASPEVTTSAGYHDGKSGTNTWAATHDSSTSFTTSNSTFVWAGVWGSFTFNLWFGSKRGFCLFDISSILGDTIDSAKLRLRGVLKNDAFTDSIEIVEYIPASDTNSVTSDYTDGVEYLTTSFASELISGLSASAYNDFTLDANGVAVIQTASDGDGIARFGTRSKFDNDDIMPTWSANVTSEFKAASPATGGQEPELLVTHSSGGRANPANVIMF